MVAVPIIYFTILSFILYFRHKKIDFACYTTIIYAVSGFFSILIDFYKLRGFDTCNYKISFGATFTYCFLLTLLLIPITIYSNARIKEIQQIRNEKLLKGVAWLFGLYFIFYAIMSFSSIMSVLQGDMGELRSNLYRGESSISWMGKLNPVARLPLSFMNMLLGCPWIPMLLAFYSYFVQKLPIKYIILFFLGSLLGPLSSIIGVDRSGMAYYLISLGACFLLFSPYMLKSQKRKLTIVLVGLVALILLYLTTLTNSRFEDSGDGQLGGSIASLISYFGQSFINFCYYFDTFTTPDPTLQLIFPFTYEYIIGTKHVGAVGLQEYYTLLTGKFTGVFYTFIGHIIISAGQLVTLLCIIVLFIIAINMLKRKKLSIINLRQLFFYYLFSSILFLGIFTHYYANSNKTFSVVAFIIILPYLNKKFK